MKCDILCFINKTQQFFLTYNNVYIYNIDMSLLVLTNICTTQMIHTPSLKTQIDKHTNNSVLKHEAMTAPTPQAHSLRKPLLPSIVQDRFPQIKWLSIPHVLIIQTQIQQKPILIPSSTIHSNHGCILQKVVVQHC